jgi:hypothetical protein
LQGAVASRLVSAQEESVKADTLDFSKLFGADVRYVVPMFQRPYVWEREKQWEPLWQDVQDVVDALLDSYARHDDPRQAEQAVPPHFLGAVVLDPLAVGSGKVDARHVIDGQQRLSTLQLLIAAIRVVAQSDGRLERHARVFSKLIANDPDLIDASAPEQEFKVWPTKWDRESFAAAMRNDPKGGRVSEAYQFFLTAVSEWAADAESVGEDELVRRFDALQLVVRSLLKVVAIDLEPNDNAQAIFEVLNARGTELLAVDLIKNLAFREAEARKEDVVRLYETYWQKFDGEPWRQEVVVGRLRRGRADQYLQHWLVMQTARDIHSQQLFPTFRTMLQEKGDSPVEELIVDLSRHADVYDSFEHFPRETHDGAFFARMEAMDVSTFMPVLLLLYGLPEDVLAREDRGRALKALESWLVRRAIIRATTRDYNKVAPTLVARINADPSRAADILIAWFKEAQGDTREWPDDDRVRHELVTAPIYTALKRARLVMILEAVERHLRADLAEQLSTTAGLHVEHVLPQSWHQHWPVADADDPARAEKRDAAKHRLGNLTLLTAKLNQAQSNDSWILKRASIQEHSLLKLSQSIVDHDVWDEDRIDERSRLLAEVVLQVWPGPGNMDVDHKQLKEK